MDECEAYPAHIIGILVVEARGIAAFVTPVIGMIPVPSFHDGLIATEPAVVASLQSLVGINDDVQGVSLLPIDICAFAVGV